MINNIFWALMNGFAAVIKYFIVFSFIGFILLLPFLLKGGFILGFVLYSYLALSIIGGIDKYNQENKGDKNGR